MATVIKKKDDVPGNGSGRSRDITNRVKTHPKNVKSPRNPMEKLPIGV